MLSFFGSPPAPHKLYHEVGAARLLSLTFFSLCVFLVVVACIVELAFLI